MNNTILNSLSWFALYLLPALLGFGLISLLYLRQRQLSRQIAEGSEKLRRSEANLAQAQQLVHLGNWSFYPENGTIEWSEETYHIFGQNPAIFTPNYERYLAQIVEADRAMLVQTVQSALDQHTTYDIEHRLLRPNGEMRWVNSKGYVDLDPQGRLLRLFGTVLDITDRKVSDLQLQQLNAELEQRVSERTAQLEAQVIERGRAEAQLRAIFNTLPDIIFLHRADGTFVDYHAPNLELLLMPPEYFLGKKLREVLPPGLAEPLMQTLQAAEQSGETQIYEYPLTVRGEEHIYEARVVASGTDEILSIVRDVTAWRHTEAALRASEAQMRAMFSALPDLIFRHRRDGTYVGYHAANLNQLLVPPEAFLGKKINDIFPPGLAEPFMHMIEQACTTGQIQLYEYPAQVQGETQYFEARVVASSNTEVLTIVRDITKRKRAEEALRQRTQELSAANLALDKAARLKDEFLASMSHELRTPLTSILGLSEALRRQIYGSLSERQNKAVQVIESSGRHLLELINDVLDLSKIEAGKLELEISHLNVEEVCESSLQLIRDIAQAKKQNVTYRLSPFGLTLAADPRRLKQMLVNLLSNAVKFTPEGGAIGLTVEGDGQQQVVHFIVWDNGIGIDTKDMPKLFQPFVQLDSRLARQYAGTGLGLSLVRRMAEMHGGRVSVESELGKGSRFTLTMPWSTPADLFHGLTMPTVLSIAEESAPTIENNLPTAPQVANPTAPLILLVEDNDLNSELMEDFLRSKEYQVRCARDGAEALALALTIHPDLILMDIQIPGMDGLEITKHIRADTNAHLANTPIIAITALAMPGDRERCLAAGANDYLSKPVHLEEMLLTVQKLLQG